MRLPQTGGCLCGAVRYEISRTPKLVYTCHCTACQRLSGSAFGTALLVARHGFSLTGPELKPLGRIADSGRTVTRWICPDCATWVYGGLKLASAPSTAPIRIRAGTLDDTSWLRPTMHFWLRSAQPWVVIPTGDVTFETQPPVSEWPRLFRDELLT